MINPFTGLPEGEELASPMSVEDAKASLFGSSIPPLPPLSVTDAKRQLLGGTNTTMGTTEAKQRLIQGNPEQMSTAQAKRMLLRKSSAAKKSAISPEPITPEPTIISEPLIAPTVQQPVPSDDVQPLISDESADTALGGFGNLIIAGYTGAVDVVGKTVTAGAELINALDGIGITEADYVLYREIKGKNAIGEPLTDEERAWLRPRGEDTKVDGLFPPNTKFNKLEDIAFRQTIIDAVQYGVEQNSKLQNTAKEKEAQATVKKAAAKAMDQFGEGNAVKGVGTFLGGIKDLAVEHPAAAAEMTVKVIPQMYVLAKNAVLGVSTLAADGYGQAIEDFREEYKREPDTTEKAVAGLLSLTSAGLDAIGAKFTLGGKKLLGVLTTLANQIGFKISGVTYNAAKTAVKTGKDLAINVVTTPVKAAVVEGGTEGAQNILTQLAGKQDISKIDGKEALVDATFGSVAGAHIAGVGSSAEAVGPIVGQVAKVANKARKAVNKGVSSFVKEASTIGNVDKAINQAVKDKDPQKGIASILSVDITGLTPEKAEAYTNQFDDFVAEYKTLETTKPNEYDADIYEELQANFLKYEDAVYEQTTGKDVKSAIDILEATTVENSAAIEAVEAVTEDILTSATLPPAAVGRTLGSSSKFKETATPEQVEIVEDYKTYQDTTNTIRTSDKVTDAVLTGSKEFTGIDQHIAAAKKAVRSGDIAGMKTVVSKVSNFLKSQKAKLDPTKPAGQYTNKAGQLVPHSSIITGPIKLEVAALEAALKHVQNMATYLESKPTPKAKPEVKAKTTKKKSKTYTELNEFKLKRPDGDIPAGTELKAVDKRITALESIWKECN